MHEPYDDEDDYDENENHKYPYNPYQWYYKFDVGPDTPLSQWINDIVSGFIGPFEDKKDKWWSSINSISGFPFKKLEFPVNSWAPNTGNDKFQYLGSNYANTPIWKTKYFVIDKLNNEYKMHLQSHAKHFVQQPNYYNGMFDILN